MNLFQLYQCEGLCSMQPTISYTYSTTTNRRIQGGFKYVFEKERKKKNKKEKINNNNSKQDIGAIDD
jgi:hypothetical protein